MGSELQDPQILLQPQEGAPTSSPIPSRNARGAWHCQHLTHPLCSTAQISRSTDSKFSDTKLLKPRGEKDPPSPPLQDPELCCCCCSIPVWKGTSPWMVPEGISQGETPPQRWRKALQDPLQRGQGRTNTQHCSPPTPECTQGLGTPPDLSQMSVGLENISQTHPK